jgi:hypothetical protein
VAVHPANIQDRDGAMIVLAKLKPLYCFLQVIFADSAGQSHMEFRVVEGWRHLLEEWRYQLGSRVPERRGTRVGKFLCS